MMRRILFLTYLTIGILSCSIANPVNSKKDKPQTPHEIALARIYEAYNTHATEIYLGDLQLTELPPEIGMLKNLQVLDLSNTLVHGLKGPIIGPDHNELPTLPPEIDNLTNLHTLLENNQLSRLPSEIGDLTS